MNAIKVVFLGEEYSFPQEVKKYIFYCHRFQGISDKFMSILSQRIKERWYDFPDKEFDELFKQEGKKVIAYLAQDDIYDVTLSELVNQNKGYICFQDMTQDGFDKWKQISINAVQEYARGYEYAQSVANSQITGSGMTLYSNSMLAHMTFAALESNTIKKQAMQADKEYRNAIARISRETQTAKEKQENEFLYKELFPAYADVIGMFVSELIEKYLDILYKHSIFDYPKAKAYDIQRSSELLNNLEVVKDKVQVLVQAFKNCPYNIEVYKKVVDLGLMDLDTFKTVQIFEQDDRIIDYIKSYCSANFGETKIVDQYISIIAFYEKEDEKTVWKSIYQNEIDCIVKEYQKVKKALIDDIELNEWIRKNICGNIEQLLIQTEEEIVGKVEDTINFACISKLQKSIDIGLLSYENIRANNSNAESLQDVNSEYCVYLIGRINEYIQKVKKDRAEETRKEMIEIEHERELEKACRIKQKERLEKNKKIVAFVGSIVAGIILILVIIFIFVPVDNRFAKSLEECLMSRREWNGSESERKEELQFEADILSYKGKWFRNKEVKDKYNLYIAGVELQEEALDYYNLDEEQYNSLWSEGYSKRCKAIMELQDMGVIQLEPELYERYAIDVLSNEISDKLAGDITFYPKTNSGYYYITIKVKNITNLDLSNIVINVFWNEDKEVINVSNWGAGNRLELEVGIPSVLLDSGEPIGCSVDIVEYEIEEK